MTSLAREAEIHFWTAYLPVLQGASVNDSQFVVEEEIDGVTCVVSASFMATDGQAGIQVVVNVEIKDPTSLHVNSRNAASPADGSNAQPDDLSNVTWSERDKAAEGANGWIDSKPTDPPSGWRLFEPALKEASAKLSVQPWFAAKRERTAIAAEVAAAPPAADPRTL